MTLTARHAAEKASGAFPTQFAADVQYYLSQDPRQLPSHYLYDDLGSALFEAICQLPWYPLKRAEMRLLQAHAPDILHDAVSRVVELGSGSGDKLAALISMAGPSRGTLDLHLIDVSVSALTQATRALHTLPRVCIVTHEATYEIGLEQFAAAHSSNGRALALFLGSNIGNFDPPGREAFLRRVRTALKPGDALLLGADLIKPERQLLMAYDDPLGVTAAFNRNLLVRINRELKGNMDLEGFVHRALWNPAHSRVEMHLVSTRDQDIQIPAATLNVLIRQNESIWTESSYKYEPAEIVSIVEGCGFHARAQWVDTIGRFALTLADAV